MSLLVSAYFFFRPNVLVKQAKKEAKEAKELAEKRISKTKELAEKRINEANHKLRIVQQNHDVDVSTAESKIASAYVRDWSAKHHKNKIYIFSDHNQLGVCIGQTVKDDVEDRIKQEYKNSPIKPYYIHHWDWALHSLNNWFTDHDFHKHLERRGYRRLSSHDGKKSEWFDMTAEQAKAELNKFKSGGR